MAIIEARVGQTFDELAEDLTAPEITSKSYLEATVCLDGIARVAEGNVAYTLEEPLYPTDKTAKLIVPGLFGIKPVYEDLAHQMAISGQRAISIRPMRKPSWRNELHPDHLFHPLRLSSQSVWAVMREIRRTHDVDDFDLLAHSMGGPTAIEVAQRKPKYIRTIILAGSAGLDGHNLLTLAAKLPAAAHDTISALLKIENDKKIRVARHILHYLLQNPVRTATETIAVSNCNIKDGVQRVRDLGIKVGRLQFVLDHFFPLENITEDDQQNVDLFHIFHVPSADHLAPITHPTEVAQTNKAMLEELLAT